MRKWLCCLCVTVVCVLFKSYSAFAVPGYINYQGKLADSAGVVAEGMYQMQFDVYDAPVEGSSLWGEEQEVQVDGGVFQVHLGSATSFPPDLFDITDLYLEIGVYNGSSWEILTPRQLLTSTPFAMRAEVAENVIAGSITALALEDGAALDEIVDNDGDGSGLDSDLLDGKEADFFAAAGHVHSSLYVPSGGTSSVLTDSAGNVGVGTSLPSYRLDVEGTMRASTSAGPNLIIHDTSGISDRPGIMFTNNTVHYIAGDDLSDEYFGLYAGYGNSRSYDSHWRVYGKATDDWGTYIELTHDGTDGKIETDVGNIVVNPAGNMGINTATPAEKLDVLGNIKVSGTGNGVVFPDGSKQTTAYVASLEARVASLESELAKLTELLEDVTRTGSNLYFHGMNVHVTNGTDSTSGAVNGLGNLIVGYNEVRGSGDIRTGSHNLVVGTGQNYNSYGGFVAGKDNNLLNSYASVSGGTGNTASASYASVSGGGGNTASGFVASVSGGTLNQATADYASVSGGEANSASGIRASVSGGTENTANYDYTWVGGGYQNRAMTSYSAVSGGKNNTANGWYASVSGGEHNTANGDNSSISAGYINVVEATGIHGSISGGRYHSVSGQYASVSGGRGNTASGTAASVSGGEKNEASGVRGSVSGGYMNTASGTDASVSGGERNIASLNYSSVSGGLENEANNYWATVSGGYQRQANDQNDWAAGSLWEDL